MENQATCLACPTYRKKKILEIGMKGVKRRLNFTEVSHRLFYFVTFRSRP